MKKALLTTLAVSVILLAAPGVSQAAYTEVFYDSFTGPQFGGIGSPWSVSGIAYYSGIQTPPTETPDSYGVLATIGPFNPATIATSLDFSAYNYGSATLSFYAGGVFNEQNDSWRAAYRVDNGAWTAVNLTKNEWNYYEFGLSPDVLGSSDVDIAFRGRSGNFFDIDFYTVDDVRVAGNLSAVPEPMSMLLFGTGLAGLAGRKKFFV